MIKDLDLLVRSAVAEVFDTMLDLQVAPEPAESPILNGEAHVASSVGFIGRLTGVVYIYSSDTFARKMTGSLLGLEPDEIQAEEMVNDAMGELANMVVGHLKSRLSDRGMPCVLTIPSIVRGSQFTVEAISSTERQVSTFRCEPDHQLVVEILIRPTESNLN